MKKLIIVLLILLDISMISCEPVKYYFKNNSRNDDIVSIELISYMADDIEIIESIDWMLDFDADNLEILETLNFNQIGKFVAEFSNIEFFQGYPHLNTPNGKGVKINYNNGDFVVVTDSFFGDSIYGSAILYDSNGLFIEYYGDFSWRPNFIDLLNKYFQIQIVLSNILNTF